MLKKIWILLGLANLFLLSACDVINSSEEVPAYIHINEFKLVTVPGEEGSASHKITEAWLFIDGQSVGAYTLPSTVPILTKGNQEIKIFAGIRQNGVGSEPDIYPFYQVYETNNVLKEKLIDTLFPQTTYDVGTNFVIIDDFQLGTVFREDLDGDTETKIEIVSEAAFEGNSAKIELTKDHPLFEVGSDLIYADFPADPKSIFLELNYKTEVILVLGLKGYSTIQSPLTRYERGVNIKNEWNKIYFNLTGQVGEMKQLGYTRFQVVFKALLPSNKNEGTIFLDNIKLIHQ